MNFPDVMNSRACWPGFCEYSQIIIIINDNPRCSRSNGLFLENSQNDQTQRPDQPTI